MIWPEAEDFTQLVGSAVKDRRSTTAAQMRDALAGPDIVHRTVEALESIVDRIDKHLEEPCDAETYRRREGARNSHYDWLVWYRTAASLAEARAEV